MRNPRPLLQTERRCATSARRKRPSASAWLALALFAPAGAFAQAPASPSSAPSAVTPPAAPQAQAGQPSAPAPPAPPVAPAGSEPSLAPLGPSEGSGPDQGGAAGLLSGLMDPFDYDPRGRRDPFSPPSVDKPIGPGGFHGPLLPLQKVPLNQISLTGVIWDVKRPRAIVEAGRVPHVVGLNAKLGTKNGYIAAIREGEIVVVETEELNGKLSSTSTVVKISSGVAPSGGGEPANK